MEPVGYSLVIRDILVSRVEERFSTKWVSGFGKEAVFDQKSLGWWVVLFGSREALYAGDVKPDLAKGDLVTIRIQKQCDKPVSSLFLASTPSKN